MRELRYTLVSDGSSDRALLPILSWLLVEHRVLYPIQADWADLGRLPNPPRDLGSRIRLSLDLYPCDLLFVHRDAERQSYTQRKSEIINTLARINTSRNPAVCVVPVRMMEAWLLFNEVAIRKASGNPNGQTPLLLPELTRLEKLSDPKKVLHQLLKDASEHHGRRLRRFDVRHSVRLVANYVDDFPKLRELSAFRALEDDVKNVININNWAEL